MQSRKHFNPLEGKQNSLDAKHAQGKFDGHERFVIKKRI